MRKSNLPTAAACGLVLLTVCATAMSQAAPAQPVARERIQMLDSIPGGSVAFVVVPNMKEMCGKVDAFVKDIMPKPLVKDFDFFKLTMESKQLGETFNANGPLAVVLLDPKEYAPRLLKKEAPPARPAARDDFMSMGPSGPREAVAQVDEAVDKHLSEDAQTVFSVDATGDDEDLTDSKALPVLYILSGKDVAKMFPKRTVKADGDLFKLSDGGTISWTREKDGLVFLSYHKKIVQAMPPKASVLVGIGGAGESLAGRADVMWWINRPRCDELAGTAFAKLFWQGMSMGPLEYFIPMGDGRSSGNPLSVVLSWFALTRGEIFRSGAQMMGGVMLTKQGPVIEHRVCFPEGSPMARLTAAAAKATGPLTESLPDKPFIFAYGIRKDLFSSPPEVKTRQVAAFIASPLWRDANMDVRKAIGDMILAIHPQVTGVEHWAGPAREDGAMAIATVVRCKDAEALKKTAKKHLGAFESMVNFAMQMDRHPNDEARITLAYEDGNAPAEGEVKADVIQVTWPLLEKALQEEYSGKRVRAVLLKGFPGEMKFRVRLAVLDKNTLVVTLGGGKRFLAETMATAKAGATRIELSADVKESLALLPASRFGVAMVDIPNAILVGSRAMMGAQMGVGGAQIKVRACPPIVVGLSGEKNDLVITAHVPTKMLKRVIGTISNMGDDEEVEDEEDTPATQPATRPAARGGALLEGRDDISVRKTTRVESVPMPATRPAGE